MTLQLYNTGEMNVHVLPYILLAENDGACLTNIWLPVDGHYTGSCNELFGLNLKPFVA